MCEQWKYNNLYQCYLDSPGMFPLTPGLELQPQHHVVVFLDRIALHQVKPENHRKSVQCIGAE